MTDTSSEEQFSRLEMEDELAHASGDGSLEKHGFDMTSASSVKENIVSIQVAGHEFDFELLSEELISMSDEAEVTNRLTSAINSELDF